MSGQLLGWEVVWRQEDTRAWRTAAYALFNLPHVDEMWRGARRVDVDASVFRDHAGLRTKLVEARAKNDIWRFCSSYRLCTAVCTAHASIPIA